MAFKLKRPDGTPKTWLKITLFGLLAVNMTLQYGHDIASTVNLASTEDLTSAKKSLAKDCTGSDGEIAECYIGNLSSKKHLEDFFSNYNIDSGNSKNLLFSVANPDSTKDGKINVEDEISALIKGDGDKKPDLREKILKIIDATKDLSSAKSLRNSLIELYADDCNAKSEKEEKAKCKIELIGNMCKDGAIVADHEGAIKAMFEKFKPNLVSAAKNSGEVRDEAASVAEDLSTEDTCKNIKVSLANLKSKKEGKTDSELCVDCDSTDKIAKLKDQLEEITAKFDAKETEYADLAKTVEDSTDGDDTKVDDENRLTAKEKLLKKKSDSKIKGRDEMYAKVSAELKADCDEVYGEGSDRSFCALGLLGKLSDTRLKILKEGDMNALYARYAKGTRDALKDADTQEDARDQVMDALTSLEANSKNKKLRSELTAELRLGDQARGASLVQSYVTSREMLKTTQDPYTRQQLLQQQMMSYQQLMQFKSQVAMTASGLAMNSGSSGGMFGTDPALSMSLNQDYSMPLNQLINAALDPNYNSGGVAGYQQNSIYNPANPLAATQFGQPQNNGMGGRFGRAGGMPMANGQMVQGAQPGQYYVNNGGLTMNQGGPGFNGGGMNYGNNVGGGPILLGPAPMPGMNGGMYQQGGNYNYSTPLSYTQPMLYNNNNNFAFSGGFSGNFNNGSNFNYINNGVYNGNGGGRFGGGGIGFGGYGGINTNQIGSPMNGSAFSGNPNYLPPVAPNNIGVGTSLGR